MKIQLAYKYTGEDREKLIEILKEIKSLLTEAGHEVYVPVIDGNYENSTEEEIYKGALKKIHDIDAILAYVISDDKSEGMIMEIGYALARDKKFFLAIKKDIQSTKLRIFADKIIEFENIENLYDQLKKFD